LNPIANRKVILYGFGMNWGRLTGETNATLRYWTKEGLLEVAETTGAGYHLYDPAMAERCREIRRLQGERYTLNEIRGKL